MNDRSDSVREAGRLIASSGLADDVIQADESSITKRRGRQREEADDAEPRTRARRQADDDEAPRTKAKKKPPRIEDDEDLEPAATDDDDADSSNRDAGDEGEEDDDAERDEADSDEEGDDTDGDADEGAQPDDGEHVVKVNGKEFTVSTKELVAGYQRSQDYHHKTTALAAKNRELLSGHSKVAEQYALKLQKAGFVIGHIKQMLVGDMDSNEMETLLRTNPQQWQIQRTLQQDRIAKVDKVLQGLNQEHERHVGEFTQTQKLARKAIIDTEAELTRRAIPDWDTKGKVRLAEYLTSKGFRNEELVNVIDSRMLTIADKARQWDAYQASKSKSVKRVVKPAPKSIRPGQSQIKRNGTQNAAKRNEYTRLKDQARKTGDTRDAGKAISRLLFR